MLVLPLPLTPQKAMSRSCGKSRSTSLRLWTRTPRSTIRSADNLFTFLSSVGSTQTQYDIVGKSIILEAFASSLGGHGRPFFRLFDDAVRD